MIYDNLTSIKTSSLLKIKISSLPISFEESPYIHCLYKLHKELEKKKLTIRPKIWGSDDWFCPDGHTSFAIPFTLFHPRLTQLQQEIVGSVEGVNHVQFMKLSRHECGHILDNAFHLKNLEGRIELFGDNNIQYPNSYSAKKFSKKFVRHLEDNYAQAHPEEDWSETFATWMTPGSKWREKYSTWEAIEKLNFVNRAMKGIQNKKMKNRNDFFFDHFKTMNITLGKYLEAKRISHLSQVNLSHLRGMAYVNRGEIDLAWVLSQKKGKIIENLSRNTHFNKYDLVKSMENLELNAHQKNLRINRENNTIKVLSEISLAHARKFLDDGKHRILM